MDNIETLVKKNISLFFIAFLLLPTGGMALDEFSQYGLGTEGVSLPKKNSSKPITQKFTNDFKKDFENDYLQFKSRQSHFQKNNLLDSDEAAFHVKFEYQDEAATISSPYHGINSELTNKLNYTSNVYQTSVAYQLKHLSPGASFNYSPDSYGFGEYYNYGLVVAVPVKNLFSIETRYGWNKFDKPIKQGGMDDYQDWSIGISTMYKGMKLKVDYIDMNADETSQECGKMFPCEGKTVFSIIQTF